MTGCGQYPRGQQGPLTPGADRAVVFGRDGLIGAGLLACLHCRYSVRAAAAHAAACHEIGYAIDPGSRDQLHTVLAGQLGLPIDRDATTNRTVLRELATRYATPLLTHLLNWHDAIHARDTLTIALHQAQTPAHRIHRTAVAHSSRGAIAVDDICATGKELELLGDLTAQDHTDRLYLDCGTCGGQAVMLGTIEPTNGGEL
jgi:hypothetical protein